jgi:4-carboxymuconolactone decarboxylase
MTPDEAAVFEFCTELLANRQVSDATYKAFVDRLGERAVVELVTLMGHYHANAALFAIDRYPLPEGVTEEIAKPM